MSSAGLRCDRDDQTSRQLRWSAHQSRWPSTSSRGSSPRLGAPMTRISRPSGGEPRPPRALHYLHSERLEGLLVEGAAASLVAYSQGQVVDEGKRHGQRHALYLRARPPGNIPEHWGKRAALRYRSGLSL